MAPKDRGARDVERLDVLEIPMNVGHRGQIEERSVQAGQLRLQGSEVPGSAEIYAEGAVGQFFDCEGRMGEGRGDSCAHLFFRSFESLSGAENHYENIARVTEAIVDAAAAAGVKLESSAPDRGVALFLQQQPLIRESQVHLLGIRLLGD
jgi:hypothetical protein